VNELPPCTFGEPLIAWANDDTVKKQLHIPDYAPDWDMCADIDYSENEIGSQWVWEKLKGKYRMLKYSGDMDACVSTIGTLNWINAMERDIIEPYRPWYTGDQVAGYVEEQDGLTFITVHGAGHMVP
jgi:serine carboxypeptidase-like clade 1